MIAFLFPGQGAQRAGMLAECRALPGGRDVLANASDILGFDVLRDDTPAALERTEAVQRNVFLAGVCSARALQTLDVAPGAVAGHSVGAVVAATVAGVLPFRDALELVVIRGRAMAAALGPGYGMGAVLGLSETAVQRIVDACAANAQFGETLAIGAVNAPDQIVVSGSEAAIERALALALQRGARDVRRLDISTASHTALMSGVRDALADAVAAIAPSDPRVPVAANVDGRALFRGADVIADLVAGVAVPVRWYDATQMLYERGTRCFVEAFPGDTLTALAERAFDDAAAISLGRSGLAATARLAIRSE